MKLDITERLVRETVEDMAPLVEGITGWGLELSALGVRVLPKDRGYEEIVLARIQGAGVSIDENAPRNIIERIVEYVVEDCLIAAYEPSSSKMLIIAENVDDSNIDGLRLVVAHELVHRGQHLHHPEVFATLDITIRKIFSSVIITKEPGIRDIVAHVNKIQSTMNLLESHAFYVQERLYASHFPGAQIESHFNLPAILMRVFGRRKLVQYKKRLPDVARAFETGTIESLYREILLDQ
jgi:hypothetical protein